MPISLFSRFSPALAAGPGFPTFAALVVTAITLLAPSTTRAQNTFTFDGAFTQDDQVQVFALNLSASNNVTILTTSVAQGGFGTALTLYSNSGAFVADSYGAFDPVDFVSPPTDASLSISPLAPGSYLLALTQIDNLRAGSSLADGFTRQGQGNYTSEFSNGLSAAPFIAYNGSQRGGNYSVTIRNVGSAGVAPEPGSAALVGALMLSILPVVARRRRTLSAGDTLHGR